MEGRLQTRNWTGQDGQSLTTTEIVISDMIILDKRGDVEGTAPGEFEVPEAALEGAPAAPVVTASEKKEVKKSKTKKEKKEKKEEKSDEPADEDIPF